MRKPTTIGLIAVFSMAILMPPHILKEEVMTELVPSQPH